MLDYTSTPRYLRGSMAGHFVVAKWMIEWIEENCADRIDAAEKTGLLPHELQILAEDRGLDIHGSTLARAVVKVLTLE